MVTPDLFKSVMRRWAATVNVVTTRHQDAIHGLTVTAFTSLSADPALVLVCIFRSTRTHAMVKESGVFCVNILPAQMKHISERFAGRVPGEDRFAGVACHAQATGSPALDDAIAWLDCRVISAHDEGDHTLFIGQVVAAKVQHPESQPLIYLNGQYLAPGQPA